MIPPSGRIALTYLLFAAVWIFFSDNLLQQLFTAPYFVEHLESLRHWIFICATTAVLFLLLHRENAAARDASNILRESEKNFRILTETIVTAIFLHRGGRLCFVNPKATAYSGYTREELLAMDWWQLVSPEYREMVKQRSLARLEGGGGPARYELRIIAKQGEERWLEVTADSIEFEGAPVGLPSAYDIPESTLIQNTQASITMLHELHTLGIAISIDDFGTGYSSLSYLKRFPINAIKIAQSFVRDIHSDPSDAAIVSAIIAMGRSLGMKTLAEGVETKEQLAFLRSRQCDLMQGYYFSRPVTAEIITQMLGEGRSLNFVVNS